MPACASRMLARFLQEAQEALLQFDHAVKSAAAAREAALSAS